MRRATDGTYRTYTTYATAEWPHQSLITSHFSLLTSHLSPRSAAGGQPMQSASQFSHEVRCGSGSPAIMGVLFGGSRRYRTPDYRLCPAAYAFFGARPSFHGC